MEDSQMNSSLERGSNEIGDISVYKQVYGKESRQFKHLIKMSWARLVNGYNVKQWTQALKEINAYVTK